MLLKLLLYAFIIQFCNPRSLQLNRKISNSIVSLSHLVVTCNGLLCIYIFKQAFLFEILAKHWVKEVLESHLDEAPRPYQLDNVHFLFKRTASHFHGYLPSSLGAADQFARQNSNAKLSDVLGLRDLQRFMIRFE